jgi:carbon monoxide dehydrogenase subunit G
MDLRGTYLLPCSQYRAWQALNDPELLRASLKGCEKLERTSDTEFSGTVAAKIGPVSARFSGTMVQTEIDAPRGCRMVFEGQGGVAGYAKGSAHVTLEPDGSGTRLSYIADTQIGGKLAQMGARLIEGTAKSMADDFFGKFAAALSGGEPMPDEARRAEVDGTDKSEKSAGNQRLVYLAIAVIAGLSVAYFVLG